MKYDFDKLPDRLNSDSVKWHHYDEDVLPMWVADMDFKSPELIKNAILERVKHGIFGYPVELPELRQTIVNWVSKRHNWDISPDDIVLMPGVIPGFNLVGHAIADPADGFLIQTPAYPPFFGMKENVNCLQQETELPRDAAGRYGVDLDAFEAAITECTKIFDLCNPHNPTGRVFQKDELEGLAEICLRHGITICSDEIHNDLIFSEYKHIPIASLNSDIANNSVTLMAPSKTFNIAGLKSSFAIVTNPELREKLLAAKKGLLGNINLFGAIAMLTAYQECEPWLESLLEYLEANRNYMVEFINSQMPQVSVYTPEGTYLAWLNCRELDIEVTPQEFFLKEARVGLNPGETFGKGADGFVRLNFGCPRSMLTEGLERMKKAILNKTKIA
ncbi:MAG: pyridoxal phosphate-dependent aminotransferase [Anaerolineaceae bacterium]|nr:pyridoxal phosphate-dependent aminotransferase [Anaerolineaceae bacterium]